MRTIYVSADIDIPILIKGLLAQTRDYLDFKDKHICSSIIFNFHAFHSLINKDIYPY